MNEKEAFKFCPRCGEGLNQNTKWIGHLKCKSCNFDFFLSPKPCVGAIIIDNGKMLLSKRGNEPFKGQWELPGGYINKGETLEEALVREMKEELRVDVQIKNYVFSLPGKYPLGGVTYNILLSYFLCAFSGEIQVGEEIVDFKFFALNDLPSNIQETHQKAIELYAKSSLSS